MIVAEMVVTTSGWSRDVCIHRIGFINLADALAEFNRIKEMLIRRADKKNDLPKWIDINGGAGNLVTLEFDTLHSLALTDFAMANAEGKGMRDEFPVLFKKDA